MAPQRWFTQASINWNQALQNTAIYWEDKIWSYPTYTIQTSEEQVWSVHLRNQHWYLSNWDNEGMYFTLGLSVPDIDSHNGVTQGRAPNKFKDVPIFAEFVTSNKKEEEEDPIDEQIWQSPINLSTTSPMIPPTSHSFKATNTDMLIATAIITHLQPSSLAGGTDPLGSRGGPPGGRGGPPGSGGGSPGNGGNVQAVAQPDEKPIGALPTIFEGDHSKAESFIWELSTYILVNHNVLVLASFIWRITIALTWIKGPEVNQWTKQQLDWLMGLWPANDNLATY